MAKRGQSFTGLTLPGFLKAPSRNYLYLDGHSLKFHDFIQLPVGDVEYCVMGRELFIPEKFR